MNTIEELQQKITPSTLADMCISNLDNLLSAVNILPILIIAPTGSGKTLTTHLLTQQFPHLEIYDDVDMLSTNEQSTLVSKLSPKTILTATQEMAVNEKIRSHVFTFQLSIAQDALLTRLTDIFEELKINYLDGQRNNLILYQHTYQPDIRKMLSLIYLNTKQVEDKFYLNYSTRDSDGIKLYRALRAKNFQYVNTFLSQTQNIAPDDLAEFFNLLYEDETLKDKYSLIATVADYNFRRRFAQIQRIEFVLFINRLIKIFAQE